jgi:hypothetical protein
MRRHSLSIILPFVLAACAAPKTSQVPEPGTRIARAVTSPLTDLNLLRDKIPVVLIQAQKTPYLPPADLTCTALSDEVRKLDEALGPDLDVPKPPSSPSLFVRGTGAAGDAAFDVLEGAAEGLMPYRRWVRKLTGAERHSKEVAAAIAAGIVRRSFMKGIGQSLGCQAPAAPIRQAVPE